MITSIGQSIDALKEEYGLDRELVIEAMKESVLAAARKQFKSEYKGGEGLQVDWNDEEGMVEISAQKTVVLEVESPTTELSLDEALELTGDDEIEVGDMLLLPLPTEDLGRIAAQTAKQILVQKVREAIREKVFEEYEDRKGELINGLVKRFERGDLIVDLGTNLEAILPRREQTRGESWQINDRVRVVIEDVSKELRGQQVVVSRTSPELLKRLFEMEVPEIYDETVIIKSAVREPGDRAKIAVSSNEKDVDPVGACVGMKGSRVQSIIKELRGEKIDIIEWSDEPSVFAANALSPAKVSQVRITDINDRKMEVIVTEDQLSLAIGKRGQNVRLATRLVGWDIDIVSEEVLKKEITKQMGKAMASGEAVPLSALDGITASYSDALKEKGIEDIEALSKLVIDDLVEMIDLSLDEAESILLAAKDIVKLKDVKSETAETAKTPTESADESEADAPGEETEATETEATETEATETEATETEIAEVAETEAAKTDVTEAEAAKTEAIEAESDVTETEAAKTEAIENEATETEATETEAAKTEVTEAEVKEEKEVEPAKAKETEKKVEAKSTKKVNKSVKDSAKTKEEATASEGKTSEKEVATEETVTKESKEKE